MASETHLRLLPLNQMARRLRVTCAWLRDESDAGRLPHVKAAGRYLFNPDAVEAVLLRRAGSEGMEPGS